MEVEAEDVQAEDVQAEDVQAEDAQAEDVQPGSDMQREPGAAEEEEPGQYTAAELATGWGKPGNHQPPETGCVPELGLSQWGVAAVQEPINMKLLRVSSSFISVYSPAVEEEGERPALVAVVGYSALPTQPEHRASDQNYSDYMKGYLLLDAAEGEEGLAKQELLLYSLLLLLLLWLSAVVG